MAPSRPKASKLTQNGSQNRLKTVGILLKMLLEKGLETRSKRCPKGDLKEEPPQNMENVSSIYYVSRFSHVGQSKKHTWLSEFWGPYLMKKMVLKKTPLLNMFGGLRGHLVAPSMICEFPNGVPMWRQHPRKMRLGMYV